MEIYLIISIAQEEHISSVDGEAVGRAGIYGGGEGLDGSYDTRGVVLREAGGP